MLFKLVGNDYTKESQLLSDHQELGNGLYYHTIDIRNTFMHSV